MPTREMLFSVVSGNIFQPAEYDCDAIAVCRTNHPADGFSMLPTPLRSELLRCLEGINLEGDSWNDAVLPTFGRLPYAYLIVIDRVNDVDDSQASREAGVRLARLIRKHKLRGAVLAAPQGGNPEETVQHLRAWTEGLWLGGFHIQSYKREEDRSLNNQTRIVFVLEDERLVGDAERAVETASIYAGSTNYARDLTNVPGNLQTPSGLADEAVRPAQECGLSCEVLDERQISEVGMGGLTAVGQGSANPPRLIVLNYDGDPTSKEVLGLVGKGITFDTGGISLKKPEGMEEMISDMGGAAVVLAVMQAVSRLKPKINIRAVIAAAENMPSGSAYRPGDIITTLSGRTIEVLNTDAEGRIVLADAVTYAIRLGATRIVDVATLTGAVLFVLGDTATGAVTNNDAFLRLLLAASERAGEKIWQLPAYPEYRKQLDSDIADLKNSGGKWAAAITGGLFIGEFAEGLPWIHLDTGGTAWLWKERGIDPQGGTGAMVRTLLEMIANPEISR